MDPIRSLQRKAASIKKDSYAAKVESEDLIYNYIRSVIGLGKLEKDWLLDPNKTKEPIHKAMIIALHGIYKEGIELTLDSVVARFQKTPGIMDALTPDSLVELVNSSFKISTSKREVQELHDLICRNWVMEKGRSVLFSLAKGLNTEEDLKKAQVLLRELYRHMPGRTTDLRQQAAEALTEAIEAKKSIIPYGIPIMDLHMGGLSRKTVAVLAGRPGHGKTSFAIQLIMNWLDQEVPDQNRKMKVLLVSKEMSTSRVLHKMLANKSSVKASSIHRGEMTEEEVKNLRKEAFNMVTDYSNRLIIFDDVYNINDLESVIARHRPDIVVDDFIQLSELKDPRHIRIEISELMKSYCRISKEYNLLLVTLSQIKRDIETREDPKPVLSDLAETGTLEQLSSDVIFIFYPYALDPDRPKSLVEILCSKARFAVPKGFHLTFDGDHMRYYSRFKKPSTMEGGTDEQSS